MIMEPWQLLLRIGRGVLYWRKLLVVSIFLVSFLPLAVAAYYASRKPPRYTASAMILLQVRPDRIPLLEEWSPRTPFPIQLAILQSQSLAASVLESLPKTAVEDLLKNPYHADYRLDLENFFRRLVGKELVVYSPQRRALQELQRSRVSFVPKDQGMVEIRAEASNPQVAMDLVNTYIDVLMARTRSFNLEDTRPAREFLEQQLAEVREDLKVGEETLAAFVRTRGPVIDQYQATLIRLSSMEGSLAEIQEQRRILQRRLDAFVQKVDAQRSPAPPTKTMIIKREGGMFLVKRDGGVFLTNVPSAVETATETSAPPPSPMEASPFTTLQNYLSHLESRLLELQGRYPDEDPQIVQVKEEIGDTRRKLLALLRERSEITSLQGALAPTERVDVANGALEAGLVELMAQEEALQTQIPVVKKTLSGLSTGQLEYSRLLGDLERKRRLQALLVENLTTTRIREQWGIQTVKVIDPPRLPLSSTSTWSPKPFVLAVGLALMLGLGIPALIEYVHMPVMGEEDISTLMNLPVLGIVPGFKGFAALPISEMKSKFWSRGKAVTAELEQRKDGLWIFLESFRGIRTAIHIASKERPIRSLLITSPQMREGKSTVFLNLGMAFWEAGRRVILADADFYRPTPNNRPTLPRALKAPAGPGLMDLFNGKAKLQSTLVPVADGLWVSSRSRSAPAEGRGVLATPRVREVIDEMTREADLVFFDSSSLFIVSDNLLLASQVDAVILVAKAGETNLRDLIKAKVMLERTGGTILGVVINQAPPSLLRSYYRYYKRYHKSYLKGRSVL